MTVLVLVVLPLAVGICLARYLLSSETTPATAGNPSPIPPEPAQPPEHAQPAEPPIRVDSPVAGWTALDDIQLRRLLKESSS
jgi:hypothetical protein